MLRYLMRRVATQPIAFLGLAFLVFVVLRSTADPVELYLDINGTPEQVMELRRQLRLDDPLPIQFLWFLASVLRGDFGQSNVFHEPALGLVMQRLEATGLLVLVALLLAVAIGFVLGVLCAVRKDGPLDFVVSSVAVFGQSMPSFWLGILLIQLFALNLGWLPTSGYGEPEHLVLPAITLASILVPNFLLIARASVIETLSEHFVTTARAKGLAERSVILGHVVPNAVAPVLTLVGLQLGVLVGGSIVTETIFAWPGVGRLIVGSIFQRDVPVVIAGIFVMSVGIMLSNLLVDLAVSAIDPRIRRD